MSKPLIPIVLGLAFAGLAAFMTLGYLKKASAPPPQQAGIKMADVVVASKEIARGELITPDHISVSKWPAKQVPEGAFATSEPALGKVARSAIFANDLITENKILDTKSRSILSVLIPDGRRAMTIKVNEVTGIAGFIAPGSHVDVLLTVSGNEEIPASTRTVLQDVEILAIAQNIEQLDSRPTVVNTVTLNVEPPQAETLTLAANEGSLQLVLRNDKDVAEVKTKGKNIKELIGVQKAAAVGNQVELIRGGKRSTALVN